MNKLCIGFSRVDITPMLGIPLDGMFEARYNIEVLDPLCATCLAVSDGQTTAFLVSTDLLHIPNDVIEDIKATVYSATGVSEDCVYLHGTHTHNGPVVGKKAVETGGQEDEHKVKLVEEYTRFLIHRITDACTQALADRKPAKMGWTVGKAPNVAFIRRFRMKDGSIATNPGINTPDVVKPVGKLDDRVNILRFDRGENDTVVLVNFGNHPCVVNGPRVSADWPGFMYRTVEQALPETKCIFFNGCQGDVNHVNIWPGETDRYLNYDPDEKYKEVRRTYARYMGRAMAGTVLQEYDKVKYIDVETVACMQKLVQVANNKGTPEQVDNAHRLLQQYEEIGTEAMRALYPGMEFETVLGEASRMVRLENAPAYSELLMSVVTIGKVAFVGFPGEPFSGVSFQIKETPGWEMVLPTCCTNGKCVYFPMMEDYEEGAYETRDSDFMAGTAETLVREAQAMLEEIAKKQ